MWNLKYNTNQHVYMTKTDSQIYRFVVAKEEGRIGSVGLANVSYYI